MYEASTGNQLSSTAIKPIQRIHLVNKQLYICLHSENENLQILRKMHA